MSPGKQAPSQKRRKDGSKRKTQVSDLRKAAGGRRGGMATAVTAGTRPRSRPRPPRRQGQGPRSAAAARLRGSRGSAGAGPGPEPQRSGPRRQPRGQAPSARIPAGTLPCPPRRARDAPHLRRKRRRPRAPEGGGEGGRSVRPECRRLGARGSGGAVGEKFRDESEPERAAQPAEGRRVWGAGCGLHAGCLWGVGCVRGAGRRVNAGCRGNKGCGLHAECGVFAGRRARHPHPSFWPGSEAPGAPRRQIKRSHGLPPGWLLGFISFFPPRERRV